MISNQKMREMISLLLLIGVLISSALVLLGGILYLIQHGHQPLQVELLKADTFHLSIKQIWQQALSFTPVGFIELGLLALVATQILRVMLLGWFYTVMRDYWFIFFTYFILIVLLYSTFISVIVQ